MLIDCDRCEMQHSEHCRDCIVTVLVDPSPRRQPMTVNAVEERALNELSRAGLVPCIRMRPRSRSA